jgi:hypothetical protein
MILMALLNYRNGLSMNQLQTLYFHCLMLPIIILQHVREKTCVVFIYIDLSFFARAVVPVVESIDVVADQLVPNVDDSITANDNVNVTIQFEPKARQLTSPLEFASVVVAYIVDGAKFFLSNIAKCIKCLVT